MPKHTLYVSRGSAPCRAVLYHLSRIAKRVEGVEPETYLIDHADPQHLASVEILDVDLQAGEHKDVLAEVNPLHCVPTLVTPHGPVWESRAIMLYLAELAQTSNPDAWTFYPRRLYQRAVVNRLLDWDQGSFYRAIGSTVYPLVFQGKDPDHEALENLAKVFQYLDEHQLADGRPYLAGVNMTVADISIAMGASMVRLGGLEIDDLPNFDAWLARMEASPGWREVNVAFDAWLESTQPPATASASDEAPEAVEAAKADDASESAPPPASHTDPSDEPTAVSGTETATAS